MKVIANGGLNLSILDGWWDEGYMPENGWKIDSVMDDSVSQDDLRNSKGVPEEWIKKIKSSVKNLAGFFSTNRMVKDYCDKFYMKVK